MKSRFRAYDLITTPPLAALTISLLATGNAAAQSAPSDVPPAPSSAPVSAAPALSDAGVTPQTNVDTTAAAMPPTGTTASQVSTTPAGGTAMPPSVPPPVAPVTVSSEDEAAKKINMGFWMRIAGVMQNPTHQNRINRPSSNAEVEAHFSNRMRKWLQWTADFVGTYGAGSVDGAGRLAILDLIAQLEPADAFNVWAGRMLVPSDRANFAGPYFMAPWIYPGAFGAGPRQGPFGRNDGATVWGQFGGGLFKYYAGIYNLYGDKRANGQYSAPLFSGRLNLSLLNPEPGFYHNATYYGQNILAIGVGAQYQKNGTPSATIGGSDADYSLFNTDVLLELGSASSGTVDVEGALYAYFGDNESRNLSYFTLASYLTPEVASLGRFQPLVRLQQTTYRDLGAGKPDTATAFDAQIGYVVDKFATRFALGMQHAKDSAGLIANQAYLGVQLMK